MSLAVQRRAGPVAEARKVLSRLYQLKSDQVGHRLESKEFYPVTFEAELGVLLPEWKIVRVESLGTSAYGLPIAGRCDPAQKAILIATSGFSAEKIAYTIAHELGHAVMHRAVPVCIGGGLHRLASARQSGISNPDPDANMREREAEVFAKEFLMPEKAVRTHFAALFGQDAIWHLSNIGESLCPDGELEPKRVATRVAEHSSSGEVPSLKSFFGVSSEAMGIRLLELRLVY